MRETFSSLFLLSLTLTVIETKTAIDGQKYNRIIVKLVFGSSQ